MAEQARLRKADPREAEPAAGTSARRAAGDRAAGEARVNASESPLDWLNGRTDRSGKPFLAPEEFEAGERLRRDFTVAAMMPAVTADWTALVLPRGPRRRSGGESRHVPGDAAIAARQRVHAALAAVGPGLSGLLVDVCCLLTGLEESERARLWPKRSAKVVLKIALAQLARHYGIGSAEPAAGRRRRHAWGREGFRPVIGLVSNAEDEVLDGDDMRLTHERCGDVP